MMTWPICHLKLATLAHSQPLQNFCVWKSNTEKILTILETIPTNKTTHWAGQLNQQQFILEIEKWYLCWGE